MGALLVVFLYPRIQVGLEFLQRSIDLLPERRGRKQRGRESFFALACGMAARGRFWGVRRYDRAIRIPPLEQR